MAISSGLPSLSNINRSILQAGIIFLLRSWYIKYIGVDWKQVTLKKQEIAIKHPITNHWILKSLSCVWWDWSRAVARESGSCISGGKLGCRSFLGLGFGNGLSRESNFFRLFPPVSALYLCNDRVLSESLLALWTCFWGSLKSMKKKTLAGSSWAQESWCWSETAFTFLWRRVFGFCFAP